MNEIQRLIHEMCPDGVPMVALGALFDLKNGYTPSKNEPSYWENGNLPWFRLEDIRENGRILNDSILHITAAGIKKSGLFPANSIIVATSATIGEHALITVDFICNQRFTCLTTKTQYKDRVDMKFYFYVMFEVDEWCKSHVNQGGFASVDMSGFSSIEISLPPLPIQRRIVEILDKFTSLVSSLDSEIALRQKQYEYYRNKLLSFEEGDEGVEWNTLNNICEIRGRIGFRGYTREDQVAKGAGAIALSPGNIVNGIVNYDICTFITWAKYEESPEIKIFNGDILFCKTGSTVGKVAMIEELPCEATINPQLVVLKNIKIDAKFLKYFLATPRLQTKVKALAGVGSVPNISQAKLGVLVIPIPPKSVQHSIVQTLDTFESLIANLKKERELRQKQYEYYREKLLTFE